MNDLRKAAEMALEALEDIFGKEKKDVGAINALRQALAQEWVCCVCGDPNALGIVHSADAPCFHYAKREWVGLTDEEVKYLISHFDWRAPKEQFVPVIEAKLKEKNSGN
jgi:hypothetical protein